MAAEAAVAAEAAAEAVVETNTSDRFGISWRPELAAGIFENMPRIDVLEVIADDYFHASADRVRSLRTLARQIPVMLHGVGLGMASTAPVHPRKLAHMARLIDKVTPESWSEHLAFVRWGRREIGHLAAPPRNEDTVEGTLENIHRAVRLTGLPPHLENIATLLRPPASSLDEPEWISSILRRSPAGLLLDLHNLYANGRNFGYDPALALSRLPLDRVTHVHLAGGRLVDDGLLLDDHKHPVPDPVYELLAMVAARSAKPLTVILERDGEYPEMSALLAELDRARAAVAKGRRECVPA
ncbi:MAG: DUF692 domain-containing protein [Bryobacteraceae bacterium]|nr:DUF692 domain-containing protein [Bryobacteraceae bacterium]